ncbi:hypothetical protein B0T16DRAFT_402551 [Cercophora newfieldiana]|uniref:Uncharacterized protein n=1 Tax=Cercophora newfieldiana TaxID=92897 RepID=A0AA39YTP9_9PEZI|nr:hypothetical protein B0T16DRAFT_402551 [Cercophora newfieldiana]
MNPRVNAGAQSFPNSNKPLPALPGAAPTSPTRRAPKLLPATPEKPLPALPEVKEKPRPTTPQHQS